MRVLLRFTGYLPALHRKVGRAYYDSIYHALGPAEP